MRGFALVVLFGCLFLICLGTIDLLDFDEACYAEVSREMYLSRNIITPQLNGKPFYEKPPLLYWVQVVGYRLFGLSALGARIINALAGLVTILVAFLFARRPLGERTAFFSSLILGGNVLFAYLSRVALTDMLLTLSLVLCLGCSYRAVEDTLHKNSQGTLWFLAACLASAVAMLAKGAIGVLLPVASGFFFLLAIRRLRILFRPLWFVPGILIICLVGLSWYILIGLTHPDGFLFMRDLFLKHHVGRFASPMQGHSGPIVYYIPLLLIGFLPWSPFVPLALSRTGLFKPHDERTRFLCLFGIFAAITFVFFSLAGTKLPNYIIPVLPGLAFITATLFVDSKHTQVRGARWAIPVCTTAFLLIVLAAVLVILPALIPRLPDILGEDARKAPGLLLPIHLGLKPYVAAAVLAALALAVIVAWRKNRLQALVWSLFAAAFGMIIIVFFGVMPAYNTHFAAPLTRLSVEAGKMTPKHGRVILVELRDRPSVIFYSGKNTEHCGSGQPEKLMELLHSPDIEAGITTDYYLSRLQESGLDLEKLKKDTGYVLFKGGHRSSQ